MCKPYPRVIATLSIFVLVLSVGCGEDDPASPAGTGTIVIDPSPDALEAPWTLSGPDPRSGAGDATLTGMPVGAYTLTWGEVAGWARPASASGNLAAGDTLTFTVIYQPGGYVLIPPGSFMMGSPTGEPQRGSNETQHQVTLTRGFYMSKYEVTEQQWYEVMGGTPITSSLPKDYVSWDMAVAFCNALSLREGLTPAYTINGSNGDVTWNQSASGYRLPTEAEWEYACRATTTQAFHNGTNCLSSDTEANYNGQHPLTDCPTGVQRSGRTVVGTFPANQWGLHDMHGNLWEWVWDGYRSDYQNLPAVDPVHNVALGAVRVIRGGLWLYYARYCRSAYRASSGPDYASSSTGFRPLRSAF
ncbi:MAG: formylglycine-generating enzyme family protein [Candidatus Krumholzibacteriia bacterium]